MVVVGIETASRVCGVALAGPDGWMAEYRIRGQSTHGETLADAVSMLLGKTRIGIGQIDGVAVSIGPGSFTGLRIGLGFAKGFAFGRGLPLVAVPTMDGLAVLVPTVFQNLCILMPSKKGEVYQGLYRREPTGWILSGQLKTVAENQIGEGWPEEETVFIGEGAVQHAAAIQAKTPKAVFFPEVYSLPSGYGIARRGRDLLMAGQRSDIGSLVPQYLKRFQGVE